MQIQAFATPAALIPGDLRLNTAIVIDALRMTTSAAVALSNGCEGIWAVAEVDEARTVAARCSALLGGERGGLRVEGFDMGNSPREYSRERVAGKRIVMTTTNGTRAIAAASEAERVVLGAFVNAEAVAAAVNSADRLSLLCAGTAGRFALEDAMAAGAIIARIRSKRSMLSLDDMALACERLYTAAGGDLSQALSGADHWQRLHRLGFQGDLKDCMAEDSINAVPEKRSDGWFAPGGETANRS